MPLECRKKPECQWKNDVKNEYNQPYYLHQGDDGSKNKYQKEAKEFHYCRR